MGAEDLAALPEIDVPVMILAGTKDRLAGYRNHAVRLHHDILSSRLKLWPGTGHMLHHIHPSGVVDAIEEVWDMAEEREEQRVAAAPLQPTAF